MKNSKRFIRFLIAAVLALIFLPAAVSAEETVTSGTCGENVTWNYDAATGHLTISGTGAMTDFEQAEAPWYAYCDQILTATISEGITNVGDYTFYNCENMTAAGVPDTVTRIGDGAFCYCESLEEIKIPQGVTYIGERAYRWCLALEEIHIPDSVTTIAYAAFSGCSRLNSVVIPDSVTDLGRSAFSGCKYLTSVTLPKNITVISESLFSTCWFLDNVVIPDGVERIDLFAFAYCNNLNNISIPDSVTEIAGGVFADCYSMTHITLPDGITAIRSSTFAGCGSLTSMTIPDSVTVIEAYAFEECRSLESIAIPAGVTSIGAEAFAYCTSLSRITLPDSVTSLGEKAFAGCGELKNIKFSENLTSICSETFNGAAINQITIPKSVGTLENFAFFGADHLSKVVFQGDAPVFGSRGASDYVFGGLTLTAYYPEDNATWTEDVKQNYGGTVTWIAGDGYEPEIEQPADDLAWSVSGGVLTISGNGGMGDYTQTTMPWYDYKDQVTSVVICEGITSVGSWSFCNFIDLSSVSIPSTVTRIGSYAFYNNGRLELPVIPESVATIEPYAFYACHNMTGLLEIPGSVAAIGKYAFSRCTGLENVILEEGVQSVGEGGFSDCTGMKQMVFYSSVSEWGENVLGGCTGLLSVNVSEDNRFFASEAGALLSKDMTRLIHFPAGIGGICQVPASVRVVDNHAFRSCSLQWVCFAGDAPIFGTYAFYDSTATVRYPLGNKTWTEDVMQDYGGNLSWMATDTREASDAQFMKGVFSYHSELTGKTAEYSFLLDENWFFASSKTYNHDLARMSLRMAMSASWTTATYIEDLFDTMGLTAQEIHYPTPTIDTIGYAIGSKKITANDETVTLIAVAVRGGGYQAEWGNNFVLNTGMEHAGFKNAADTVSSAVKEYINHIGADENIRIWVTGYSRGAAVANLTAHRLNRASGNGEILGLDVNSIYAYCFECPAGVKTNSKEFTIIDQNIFNIVNPVDIVPMAAPLYWDYSRYGITYFLPSGENSYNGYKSAFQAMKTHYGYIADAAGMEDLIFSGGNTYVPPEDLYTDTMMGQNNVLTGIVASLAHGIGDEVSYTADWQSLISSGLAQLCAGDSDSETGEVVKFVLEVLSALNGPKDVGGVAKNALSTLLSAGLNNVAYAHYPELCLAWMDSLEGAANYSSARSRNLVVNCPVDISVFDSAGILVAQITDDVVQEIEGSTIHAWIDDNGQKVVCLASDETFEIRITATGDGTMSYRVEEYELLGGEVTRLTNYYDVRISQDDTFTGVICAEADDFTQHTLADEEGTLLQPSNELTADEVVAYTVSVSGEGCGTVSGGGLFVIGEYAMVMAEPEAGADFIGWYCDEALVSSDLQYRFRVEQDMQIIGKFAEAPAPMTGITRLSGMNRYLTSFAVADQLKENLGITQFETAIVAYGQNFPDALTGSYLAAVKNAPILLTEPSVDTDVLAYLQENLVSGGKVYILGGTAVVSQNFEDRARDLGFDVTRLKGAGRYETNLAILQEAGVNDTDEILIATGRNYADSLSASATGLPIVLVDKTLTDAQKEFLEGSSRQFVIIGGTGAVSAEVEAELSAIGTVTRIKGANRYGTSVALAERYFATPEAAVLAYAQNFPDGLCGGPLAISIGAPLILTSDNAFQIADDYVTGIETGAVTGGTGRISDDTVREIFDLAADTPISKR